MNKLYVFRALIILEWILFFSDWLIFHSARSSAFGIAGLAESRDRDRKRTHSYCSFFPIIHSPYPFGVRKLGRLVFPEKMGGLALFRSIRIGCLSVPIYGPVVEHALTDTINNISFVVSGIIIGMILFTNVVLEQPLVE